MPLVSTRGGTSALGFGFGGFLAADGDFESIATVTVGSGGASEINFTSVPSGYQHLQIRYLARSTNSSLDTAIQLRVGNTSIDTGSNYTRHYLFGDGSALAAGGSASQSLAWLGYITAATASASIFGAGVIDILDYASTSKNKTVRTLHGDDANHTFANFTVGLTSNLWMSTSVIDTIRLYPAAGNFVQHSTAALYGIKAP